MPSGEAGSFTDEQNLQQTDTFYDYDYDDVVAVTSTVSPTSSTENSVTTTQEPTTTTTTSTTTTQEPTTTTNRPSTTTIEPPTSPILSELP